MPVVLNIPDEIVSVLPNDGEALERDALQAIVLELYRKKRISAGKVGDVLGIGRIGAELLLSREGLLKSPTFEEVLSDCETLNKVLGRG